MRIGRGKPLEPDEAGQAMIAEQQLATARSSVSFVDPLGKRGLIGSGTFVIAGEVLGVLTCGHVLHELQSLSQIGLVCFPVNERRQRWAIPTDYTTSTVLGAAPWDDTNPGPDLGFLRLPPSEKGHIEAIASIVNLERHRALAALDEPSISYADIVIGAIGEWTVANTPMVDLSSLISAGIVDRAHDFGEHDYLRHVPVPGPDQAMPRGFGGTSGGGLWRMYFGRDAGRTFFVQRRLCGVAFRETDSNPETKLRNVICHGPRSLFGVLFSRILELKD